MFNSSHADDEDPDPGHVLNLKQMRGLAPTTERFGVLEKNGTSASVALNQTGEGALELFEQRCGSQPKPQEYRDPLDRMFCRSKSSSVRRSFDELDKESKA